MVVSFMSDFKDVPDKYCPDKSEHIKYNTIFRGIVHLDKLDYTDFLPSHIQYERQRKTFKNLFNSSSDYSCSLFTELDTLKISVSQIRRLRGYAQGFTDIKRGVSCKENRDHHVDYFLYDYENNSPCDDFKVIEEKDNL